MMKLAVEPPWSLTIDAGATAGDALPALARILLGMVAQDRQAGSGAPAEPVTRGTAKTRGRCPAGSSRPR